MNIVAVLNRWPAVLIAGIVVFGTSFQVLPIAVVRAGAILALLAQVFQERRVGGNQFLTSPLFLLAAVILVFFSLALGVVDTTYPNLPFHEIETFYGSDADRLFIIFGLCCLVAHSGIVTATFQARKTASDGPAWPGTALYIFAVIAMGVTVANVANYLSQEMGGPHITAIRSLAAPVLAFCLLFLVRQSMQATVQQKLLIGTVMVLAIVGLFFIQEGKKPVFIIVACLLYWFRLNDISMKKLVILSTIFIPAAIGMMQIVQIIRVPKYSVVSSKAEGPMAIFGNVIRAKLVLRQTETRYCFQKVIDAHGQQPFSISRQIFWLKGLVPRIVWPDKPSLSLGRYYGRKYCDGQEGGRHTNSISLLGQPVIYGGWAGLALHGGILIVCLGALVWLGRNPENLSAVTAAALLPWLIDFDQDFALYVANAVKFSMVMAPLVFLAHGMANKEMAVRDKQALKKLT